MTRAPGKYKQKRGGGRSFSRNLTLNEDGIAVGDDSRSVVIEATLTKGAQLMVMDKGEAESEERRRF
jgi:hypothetical protein